MITLKRWARFATWLTDKQKKCILFNNKHSLYNKLASSLLTHFCHSSNKRVPSPFKSADQMSALEGTAL